jgi:putative transposase
MPQSLSQVYVHLIFSPKGREPLLRGSRRGQMHAYWAAVRNNHSSPAIRVGGTVDHIHALFRLSKNRALAEVVEESKTSSSRWIKTQGRGVGGFHGQNGYGGFSVSPGEREQVVEYIDGQETHHRARTFQDEYRRFLEPYQVEDDERYVWD